MYPWIPLLVCRNMWTLNQSGIDPNLLCAIYFDNCGIFLHSGSRNIQKGEILLILIIHQTKRNSHMNQMKSLFGRYGSWWGRHGTWFFPGSFSKNTIFWPLWSALIHENYQNMCGHIILSDIFTKIFYGEDLLTLTTICCSTLCSAFLILYIVI